MRTMKKAFLVCLFGLLAVVFSSPAFSRNKKIKYDRFGFVVYEGEVVNKVPSGNGTLTVKSYYKQFSDVMTGTFDCPVSIAKGTVEGEIRFSSNYLFKGVIGYEVYPSRIDYTLSKGAITIDTGETFTFAEDEVLHFSRKFGTEAFEMSLPDQENVMWQHVGFIHSGVYYDYSWGLFKRLMDRLKKHIGPAKNYQIRVPYQIAFVQPDRWELQERRVVKDEIYYLSGEDDFSVLAISKGDGQYDWTFFLIDKEPLTDLLVVHFPGMARPAEITRRFGTTWDNYLSFTADDSVPFIQDSFPEYWQIPYQYQNRLRLSNYVSIVQADGSAYGGSISCHGKGDLLNDNVELMTYLMFDIRSLDEIQYYTGKKKDADGTLHYFAEAGSYDEWKRGVDAEVAAENERIARENEARRAREEAELRAQREKAEAEYNAECKKYGKKYVDKARNYQLEIGMPEELFLKYFSEKRTVREGLAFGTWTLRRVYTSSRRTQYRLDLEVVAPFTTDESVNEWISVWFENGKLTSFSSSV